jgi:hypothetical protein
MRPILTLRHYTQAPIDHSHDHAQLVFGLSGHLDFEVEGRGSQVRESSVMVLPYAAHHVRTPAAACSINRRAWPWTPGNTSWCSGWHIAR